jgi:hypothetical protein
MPWSQKTFIQRLKVKLIFTISGEPLVKRGFSELILGNPQLFNSSISEK